MVPLSEHFHIELRKLDPTADALAKHFPLVTPGTEVARSSDCCTVLTKIHKMTSTFLSDLLLIGP